MGIYYNPEESGLKTVGEIDWSDGCYQFDLTVVWQRVSDGALLYGEDMGCSCPSPFEDMSVEDLTVTSLADFQAHCAEREKEARDGSRQVEVAQLLERMHAAGAR